jgi:hypothetical protein
MSVPAFDAESLKKVIQGQLITFSGRRVYRVHRADLIPGGWLQIMTLPDECYGAYPTGEAADKAHEEWCRANARDPLVDEILADRYSMCVFLQIWSLEAMVAVRNPIIRNMEPKVMTLEIQPCT